MSVLFEFVTKMTLVLSFLKFKLIFLYHKLYHVDLIQAFARINTASNSTGSRSLWVTTAGQAWFRLTN
jgi:hypothetical protein